MLANLGLALASMVVVLALAEVGARVFLGPVQPRNLTRVPASIRAPAPFEGVPFLLRANAAATQDFGSNPSGYFDGDGSLTYRTNSKGWRTPEFRRQKASGTFRVLGIGDSFTFGTGVRREHLFLTVLGGSLDAEAPGRFEVINLGVMGFGTSHEVALLRNVGSALEPDLVVICYVLNDASMIRPLRRNDGKRPEDARPSPAEGKPTPGPGAFGRAVARQESWLEASVLASRLRERLRNREARERAVARTLADYEDDYPGWRSVQKALGEVAELARDRDFAIVLMIFPNLWELSDEHPFAPVHAKVRAEAERVGIPVLDLLDAFRGEDGPSLWVHPSNQHPNRQGHAIAAAALHRFLRERELLGSSSRRDADSDL